MQQRQFNYRPSKIDPHDYSLKSIMQITEQPRKTNHEPFCGPVYDQGESGLCWAFALTALLNWFKNKAHLGSTHILSPLYLAQAVKRSGYAEYPAEEGESLRAAMKGAQKAGSVAEEDFPFANYKAGSLLFPTPSERLIIKAERFKIGPYARATNFDELYTALTKSPVPIGIYCTSEMLNNYWMGMPNGRMLGPHALLAVDRDDDLTKDGHTGWIRAQNSWDKTWGDNGFGWISYDYLRCISDLGFPFLLDAFSANDIQQLLAALDIEMTVDNQKAKVDGIEYTLDQAPVIDSRTSRTLVPLRFAAEQAGYQVNWDGTTKKITMIKEK